jgi:UPF0755 protein
MKILKSLFVLLILGIMAAIGGVLFLQGKYQATLEQNITFVPAQTITIKDGDTAMSVLQNLEKQNLIKDVQFIRIGSSLNNKINKFTDLLAGYFYQIPQIKKGDYLFDGKVDIKDFLAKLAAGKVMTYKITLLEGWNIKQVRAALAQNQNLVQTITNLSDEELLQTLEIDAPKLEGMFFPDTYVFTKDTKDIAILKQAHQRLMQYLADEWDKRAADIVDKHYKNPYDALIMASMIERETGTKGERDRIAGVFIRRLNLGMRLQTDPTVIYGMGDAYTGKITRKDLTTPTAYNTYTIFGMPPTPIALPSLAAIQAALNPTTDDNALYFVAKGDGSHIFSSSLDGHNKAVREFQINRRADYKSY